MLSPSRTDAWQTEINLCMNNGSDPVGKSILSLRGISDHWSSIEDLDL